MIANKHNSSPAMILPGSINPLDYSTNRALELASNWISALRHILGGRRRKNIPPRRASESNCLKYLQRQFLLRGCEAFSPKTKRSRVTNVAEINARDAVTWRSWTDYLCAKSTDGLVNDDICRFLFFFEGVRVSAKIKPERPSPTNSPTNESTPSLFVLSPSVL